MARRVPSMNSKTKTWRPGTKDHRSPLAGATNVQPATTNLRKVAFWYVIVSSARCGAGWPSRKRTIWPSHIGGADVDSTSRPVDVPMQPTGKHWEHSTKATDASSPNPGRSVHAPSIEPLYQSQNCPASGFSRSRGGSHHEPCSEGTARVTFKAQPRGPSGATPSPAGTDS